MKEKAFSYPTTLKQKVRVRPDEKKGWWEAFVASNRDSVDEALSSLTAATGYKILAVTLVTLAPVADSAPGLKALAICYVPYHVRALHFWKFQPIFFCPY